MTISPWVSSGNTINSPWFNGGQPGLTYAPATQAASSGMSADSLSSLFDFPELKIDFTPIQEALTRHMQTAETASGDMRDWASQRGQQQDQVAQQAIDTQLGLMRDAGLRSKQFNDAYQTKYAPLEDQLIQEAKNAGSEAGQERAASVALADMSQRATAERNASRQRLLSMGINPNSGRFAALEQQGAIDQGAATAGAMTAARDKQHQYGLDMLGKVADRGRALLDAGNTNAQLAQAAGSGAVGLSNSTGATIANEKASGLTPLNTAAGIAQGLGSMALQNYGLGLSSRVAAATSLGRAQGQQSNQTPINGGTRFLPTLSGFTNTSLADVYGPANPITTFGNGASYNSSTGIYTPAS